MNLMLFGLFKIYETTHSHNIGDTTAYLDSNDLHNTFQFVNCHGELQFLKFWSNSDVMEECFHVSTLEWQISQKIMSIPLEKRISNSSSDERPHRILQSSWIKNYTAQHKGIVDIFVITVFIYMCI